MTHSTKTYKIQSFYRILYSCTYDVLKSNKSPLLKAFLNKELGHREASELDLYLFNELMELMIEKLKEEIEASSYIDVSVKVRFHERYQELRKIGKDNNLLQEHVIANFRISDKTVKDIRQLKNFTLGEVVELAIMLFVLSTDERTYQLIHFSFENTQL